MNAKDAWLATLGQLQVQLNRSTYDTWLRRAELLGYEDGRFVVTVPNAYARDWIEKHLLESMTQTLRRIFQRECELQFIVWNPLDSEEEAPSGPLFEFQPESKSDYGDGDQPRTALNPAYRFDSYVVGESNHYAALLAQAIPESQIGHYSSTLFIGQMGMGKTHLLQAITHVLLDKGMTAVYTTAENFTTELVGAIRQRNNLGFREKFRNADVVLVDDLQFVEGKDSTQSELVAIWDALRNRQRAMIFASDRLPRDMTKISGDARSRFQAGPIALLEAPDLELRRAILAAKSVERGLILASEVCDVLAVGITTNARDLESAIEQLHSFASITRQPITPVLARRVLDSLGMAARESDAAGVTLETVLTEIATYYNISIEDFGARSRTKVIAQARQLAMFLARELGNVSLLQIGDALGGRNHSTVVHGCAKIAEMIAADLSFAREVGEIRARISQVRPESVPVMAQRRR